MAETLQNITGRIILVAHLEAKPDKIADVETALLAIKANADSDAEPGCFTYRVSKFGHQFVVFEEYENAEAVKTHVASEPYRTFGNVRDDKLAFPTKIRFYEESKL